MVTDEARAVFVGTADSLMAASGLEPIEPSESGHSPDALVRMYYRPEAFQRQVDETGTYGAVAVCASGYEINKSRDLEALATERALAAVTKYEQGAREMERGCLRNG